MYGILLFLESWAGPVTVLAVPSIETEPAG